MEKKLLSLLIFIVLTISGFALASDSEVPPEVPPCPEEYEDGLKP